MSPAPLPSDEPRRLAALQSYGVLDSVCETSFDNIVHLAAQLVDVPISLVSLVDSHRQWFKAKVGLDASETPRDWSFCAHAIVGPDEVFVVDDALADRRFVDNPLVTGAPGIRFYAGARLINPEGAALGTLCVIDRAPRTLSDGLRQGLRRLAGTAMTTLELRRAMNRAQDFARVDFLTGLANRHALIEAIERAIARQGRDAEPFALLFLDLDGFKQVNDRSGHAAGDRVLCEVAVALRASLRGIDIAARIGGDEFAVLLTGAQIDVAGAAERIRSQIAQHLHDRGWPVTASVGASTFTATPPNADMALTMADAAMYQAKRAGKNRVSHRSA
jgi:diguanylate cyclase (GGDEF)-like protein